MRGALKRLENREYKDEIKTLNDNLARDEVRLSVKKRECEGLNSTIEEIKSELGGIEEKIDSIPADVINIDQVISRLKAVQDARSTAVEENKTYAEQAKEHGELFRKLDDFIVSFDKESFKTKIDLGEKYQKQIDEAHNQIKVFEMKHESHKKKINILNQVPCGDTFPQCHFIKDAHEAKGGLTGIASNLKDLKQSADKTNKVLDELEVNKASEYLNKYDKVFQKKINTQERINELNLKIEKNKTLLLRLKSRQTELQLEKENYDLNKDAIENLEKLLADKNNLSDTINKQEKQYNSCHEEVMQLYKEIGSSEQKLEQANMDYEEYLDLQNEYAAYDLFMRCMHSNGISYDVVKKRLPLINEEISKILTNIVEFEIMFENEEKKLDILIKHPKHDPRPIEMGSGAEKTIAAMALRLALLNISTLPKSDMFILDEPGTALDEENMEGFTRILDMIKTQFKTVVLISHLDSLKDSSDLQILIDKDEDGFAHVEF
jgi:DNA repair exonuclease SbcCD ATPase subunit